MRMRTPRVGGGMKGLDSNTTSPSPPATHAAANYIGPITEAALAVSSS